MLSKKQGSHRHFTFSAHVIAWLLLVPSLLVGHSGGHHRSAVDQGEFQDFPAMCVGPGGDAVVAYMDRPSDAAPRLIVAVDHHGELEPVATVEDPAMSAFDSPSLVATANGYLLVYSVEVNGAWKVGCLPFVNDQPVRKPVYFGQDAAINVRPAVARSGESFCIVWESNAHNMRQIFGCVVRNGTVSPPRALSPEGVAAHNPAVTAAGTENQFFVAWDSFTQENCDIYGREFTAGALGELERLSRDPRIERFVSLTTAPDGQIWLAWEACSANQNGINHYSEQKFVVAQRTANGLSMPQELFGKSGPQAGKKICRKPVIVVDASGRLHLSFRNNKVEYEGKANKHSFWTGEFWTYAGNQWYGPYPHDEIWGWWRPSPLSMRGDDTLMAALQVGIGKSYLLAKTSASSIALLPFKVEAPAQAAATVALVMPATKFSLESYLDQFSLRLPRQQISHNGQELKLYWGDLHEHTAMSQCARPYNPPAIDLLANQRDIDQLDFTALTDHGYNHCDRSWAYSRELVRSLADPGRFIPLLGIEWTSAAYGHHNLIFEDTRVEEVYHKEFGKLAPVELYDYIQQNEATGDFISLPHGLADHNRGKRWQTDWSQVHEVHQPLVEIFQARQSFEHAGAPRESKQTNGGPEGFFYQDALEHEVIIGVSASPDHGGSKGRTGVWAPELTAQSLFAAFHQRHTFGTSGAKMSLLFRSGKHFMGDKVQRVPSTEPISFHLQVNAAAPIQRIVIFRDKKIVHEITAPGDQVEVTWVDQDVPVDERLWYYVRVEREDGELAWSSPIWFLSAAQMNKPPTHSTAEPKADIFKAIDACCPHDSAQQK